MKRTWLSERINDVENGSKRWEESSLKKPNDCITFLNAFEKQLQQQLHLKNFIRGPIFLPIEKGCYETVGEFMRENGATVVKARTTVDKDCEKVLLTVVDNKVVISPSFFK